jgi:linoleoyl-CoA desaturase
MNKDQKISYKDAGSFTFYKVLRKRVKEYFEERHLSEKATPIGLVKTFILLIIHLFLYISILSLNNQGIIVLLLVFIFGVNTSLIGFNIAHDATHGAIFKSKWMNKVLSYSFNLIGASEYTWRITHNDVHHQFPNVPGVDPDIDQHPWIRMSPAQPLKWYHKYQHFYASLLYLFFGFYMVYVKDFKILFKLKRLGNKINVRHTAKEILILFLSKLTYISLTVFIPLLYFSLENVLLGNCIVLFIQGIILVVITVPAHVVLENDYLQVDSNGYLNGDWATYQLRSTIDFNVNSPWSNFFMGGGNLQVVHHLFPKIHHVHLKALSDILKTTADEFNLEYKTTSLKKALISHFKLLYDFGQMKTPGVVKYS